jgi:hypothetical protein
MCYNFLSFLYLHVPKGGSREPCPIMLLSWVVPSLECQLVQWLALTNRIWMVWWHFLEAISMHHLKSSCFGSPALDALCLTIYLLINIWGETSQSYFIKTAKQYFCIYSFICLLYMSRITHTHEINGSKCKHIFHISIYFQIVFPKCFHQITFTPKICSMASFLVSSSNLTSLLDEKFHLLQC